MRDFDFIHAAEDVTEVLEAVSGLGLIIRRDAPTQEPIPDIIDVDALPQLGNGVFMTYRDNWVFGDLKYNQMESGYRKGLYSQMPSTNCINITLYFQGERFDGDLTRLGDGSLSRDIEWYRPEDHTVHRAPADVKKTFDTIRNKIDTGVYIGVSGRRYTMLAGALKKLADESYRLPFDFMDAEPVHGLI